MAVNNGRPPYYEALRQAESHFSRRNASQSIGALRMAIAEGFNPRAYRFTPSQEELLGSGGVSVDQLAAEYDRLHPNSRANPSPIKPQRIDGFDYVAFARLYSTITKPSPEGFKECLRAGYIDGLRTTGGNTINIEDLSEEQINRLVTNRLAEL